MVAAHFPQSIQALQKETLAAIQRSQRGFHVVEKGCCEKSKSPMIQTQQRSLHGWRTRLRSAPLGQFTGGSSIHAPPYASHKVHSKPMQVLTELVEKTQHDFQENFARRARSQIGDRKMIARTDRARGSHEPRHRNENQLSVLSPR